MDSHEVARRLGVSNATVRKAAAYYGIGQKIGKMGRVYTPSDVEMLRAKIGPRPGPKPGYEPGTKAMVSEMRSLREKGLKLKQIGKIFGVGESYVSQLLKGKNK
jgi:predicted transcriptional regulator